MPNRTAVCEFACCCAVLGRSLCSLVVCWRLARLAAEAAAAPTTTTATAAVAAGRRIWRARLGRAAAALSRRVSRRARALYATTKRIVSSASPLAALRATVTSISPSTWRSAMIGCYYSCLTCEILTRHNHTRFCLQPIVRVLGVPHLVDARQTRVTTDKPRVIKFRVITHLDAAKYEAENAAAHTRQP